MSENIQHEKLIIIGSGPAGYTAAIYAARANLSTGILEEQVCGGLVNWTNTVENMPSYKSIHGLDLMEKCRDHAESLGINFPQLKVAEQPALGVSVKPPVCIGKPNFLKPRLSLLGVERDYHPAQVKQNVFYHLCLCYFKKKLDVPVAFIRRKGRACWHAPCRLA